MNRANTFLKWIFCIVNLRARKARLRISSISTAESLVAIDCEFSSLPPQNEFEKAIKDLDVLLQIHPKQADLLRQRAQAKHLRGNCAGALECVAARQLFSTTNFVKTVFVNGCLKSLPPSIIQFQI